VAAYRRAINTAYEIGSAESEPHGLAQMEDDLDSAGVLLVDLEDLADAAG
jgi:hypothetical protein